MNRGSLCRKAHSPESGGKPSTARRSARISQSEDEVKLLDPPNAYVWPDFLETATENNHS